MSSTPRGSAKPASKKPAKKKPVTSNIGLQKAVDAGTLGEPEVRDALGKIEKDYGSLVVGYNQQKTELLFLVKGISDSEADLANAEAASDGKGLSGDEKDRKIKDLQKDIEAAKQTEKSLTLKVQKTESEANEVSNKDVDMIFVELEKVESALYEVNTKKAQLEEEVLTHRQVMSSARGGNSEPKFVEIHHNGMSDDEDDDAEAQAPAPAP